MLICGGSPNKRLLRGVAGANGSRFLLKEMPDLMRHLSYRILGEHEQISQNNVLWLTKSRCQLDQGDHHIFCELH